MVSPTWIALEWCVIMEYICLFYFSVNHIPLVFVTNSVPISRAITSQCQWKYFLLLLHSHANIYTIAWSIWKQKPRQSESDLIKFDFDWIAIILEIKYRRQRNSHPLPISNCQRQTGCNGTHALEHNLNYLRQCRTHTHTHTRSRTFPISHPSIIIRSHPTVWSIRSRSSWFASCNNNDVQCRCTRRMVLGRQWWPNSANGKRYYNYNYHLFKLNRMHIRSK